MADYPIGINVGQKANWRFHNLNTVTEGFVIPSDNPSTLVRFPLSEYPFRDEPSNFVIAGMTEVETTPSAANQFRVLYDLAHIEFFQDTTDTNVTVEYLGNGSIIKAQDFNNVVQATTQLAKLKMFNAVPLSGGNFTFDGALNTIVVDTPISFLFPLDVDISFAGLSAVIPTFAIPDGTYDLDVGRFIIAVIKDNGTVTIHYNITLAQVVSNAATSVVCPLFYRNSNAAIALWAGVSIGSGQSIGPNAGSEGGGLTLQNITDNGNTTTNDIIVGGLTAFDDIIAKEGLVFERVGLDTWSAVLDTETLSTNLSFLLPDYDPGTEGPVLALRTDVTLDKLLAAGNTTANTMTVGGLYSTGDVEVDGNLILNGPILGSNLTSGTYTPTISALTNIAGSSPTPAAIGTFKYMRIGNMTHVTGRLTMRPELYATLTEFTLTLPDVMGGNFSGVGQAAGLVTTSIEAQTGIVASNTSSQLVKCSFQTSRDYEDNDPYPDPVAIDVCVSFMYEFVS